MKANELRETYLRFFEEHGHRRIPSAPLVPENDPSVLFTTAGMHPLVPFLLGEPHPQGKTPGRFSKMHPHHRYRRGGRYLSPDLFRDAGQLVVGRLLQRRIAGHEL